MRPQKPALPGRLHPNLVELKGVEPHKDNSSRMDNAGQVPDSEARKPAYSGHLPGFASGSPGQDRATDRQSITVGNHVPDHNPCITAIPESYDLPPDLAEIVSAWPDLSESFRRDLIEMVRSQSVAGKGKRKPTRQGRDKG